MSTCCSGDIRDWLALVALPGVGCSLVHRLLEKFGSPAAVLSAGRTVEQVQGIGPQLSAFFSSQRRIEQSLAWADQECDRACALDVHLLAFSDPRYPELLRTIHDPPALLYLRGNLDCLDKASVALVGARAATSYGKRVSFTLAGQLAGAGLVVTSGLALGIDGSAHAGCLEAGGLTTAVLGCGVDVVYPRSHADLYEKVLEKGLLVSEYPLATRPDGFRFPARNRIISGLSRGIIVVEAARHSGSLITASLALNQGREVFAVPGRVDSVKSEGTHYLLQQGAILVQSVDDVVRELAFGGLEISPGPVLTSGRAPDNLSEKEELLMSLIDVYPIDIDDLRVKSKLQPGTLQNLVLQLELKGLIRQLPGQQYERIS